MADEELTPTNEDPAQALKGHFRTGDMPTQTNFEALIDLADAGRRVMGVPEDFDPRRAKPGPGLKVAENGVLQVNPGEAGNGNGLAFDDRQALKVAADPAGPLVVNVTGLTINPDKVGNGLKLDGKAGLMVLAPPGSGVSATQAGIAISTGGGVHIRDKTIQVDVSDSDMGLTFDAKGALTVKVADEKIHRSQGVTLGSGGELAVLVNKEIFTLDTPDGSLALTTDYLEKIQDATLKAGRNALIKALREQSGFNAEIIPDDDLKPLDTWDRLLQKFVDFALEQASDKDYTSRRHNVGWEAALRKAFDDALGYDSLTKQVKPDGKGAMNTYLKWVQGDRSKWPTTGNWWEKTLVYCLAGDAYNNGYTKPADFYTTLKKAAASFLKNGHETDKAVDDLIAACDAKGNWDDLNKYKKGEFEEKFVWNVLDYALKHDYPPLETTDVSEYKIKLPYNAPCGVHTTGGNGRPINFSLAPSRPDIELKVEPDGKSIKLTSKKTGVTDISLIISQEADKARGWEGARLSPIVLTTIRAEASLKIEPATYELRSKEAPVGAKGEPATGREYDSDNTDAITVTKTGGQMTFLAAGQANIHVRTAATTDYAKGEAHALITVKDEVETPVWKARWYSDGELQIHDTISGYVYQIAVQLEVPAAEAAQYGEEAKTWKLVATPKAARDGALVGPQVGDDKKVFTFDLVYSTKSVKSVREGMPDFTPPLVSLSENGQTSQMAALIAAGARGYSYTLESPGTHNYKPRCIGVSYKP
ncbi:hypothetical protein [Paraburkholderia aspalathi]|uniref:hypothetical protein n=1 Tax=Paraburkholderia aspalathi TaxID=1324617 RepID=UPI0038BAD858